VQGVIVRRNIRGTAAPSVRRFSLVRRRDERHAYGSTTTATVCAPVNAF